MAYLVTLHGPPGNLSAKKCFEAGVPPGKLFAELRDGRDVVLEGGRVVRSRDVMSEEFPTQKVLVLECPTEYHLDALIKARMHILIQVSRHYGSHGQSLENMPI